MSKVCAGIQVDEHSDFPSGTNLLISSKLQHLLQLPRSPLTIHLGQRKSSSRVQTFTSQSFLIRIRKDLAEQLCIPNGIQLNIQYEPKSRRIYLGPVFGVLITSLIRTPEGIFGSASLFCKELVQEAKSKGILAYIFTLNDVDQQNQTVNGWTWMNGKWVQRRLPSPDSIYNRLASRKSENKPENQAIIESFKKKGIHYFNEHFLNKWQVHEALSKNPQVSAYLPGTTLFKGFSTIKEAVSRYPQVYLKPANGSLGKGIYRISRTGKGFTCQYSTMAGTVQKTYSSLAKLHASIGPRISKFPYLVQQGLRLIRINGNPLDFRSLAQKDRTGKWIVTSIVGRIGQSQSIVSNLARGGTIMSVGEALAAAGPWSGTRPTRNQLSQTSRLLAEGLEAELEGHFGELGIDLAVDTSGRIWLLEINAKPSKNDDQVLSEQTKTRPSVKKLLDYSLFLKNMTKSTSNANKASLIALRRKRNQKKRRKR
ncbi:hypothetical protein BEP19_04870 [Ammoniphilus oxalaticus]|uniref:ATP-grasp domain-containing protein n=1 Tax=Ammoniphilus oxalaticus TaxID=66863 RepID=A0A419SIE0_9BACL|nr:YheC/YheD family protein [Ammoniphilus oxalaticus]RKD23765.1 hypothetical protein BEP19_04870 [Ammoniphilus oxalaticus]